VERDSRQAARRLTDRIFHATRQLEQFPRVGRLTASDDHFEIREIYVQQFRVMYRVRSERVDILTVVHGARRIAELPET